MGLHQGLQYREPSVTLLHVTPLIIAELAGRTAYDSFDKSEHELVKSHHDNPAKKITDDIDSSKLMDQLAWVHHHRSVLEHITCNFSIRNTSRGVLQENSRHRIASYTVKSTRYTMGGIINAFIASQEDSNSYQFFSKIIKSFDMFVVVDGYMVEEEIKSIYNKLYAHLTNWDGYGDSRKEFYYNAVSKSSLKLIECYEGDSEGTLKVLTEGKKKNHIGDVFKHIVTDNWCVDLYMSINLRSLENYFTLRDSGSAWFLIQWLAKAMKKELPSKYLRLVDKKFRDSEKKTKELVIDLIHFKLTSKPNILINVKNLKETSYNEVRKIDGLGEFYITRSGGFYHLYLNEIKRWSTSIVDEDIYIVINIKDHSIKVE